MEDARPSRETGSRSPSFAVGQLKVERKTARPVGRFPQIAVLLCLLCSLIVPRNRLDPVVYILLPPFFLSFILHLHVRFFKTPSFHYHQDAVNRRKTNFSPSVQTVVRSTPSKSSTCFELRFLSDFHPLFAPFPHFFS